MGPWADDAKLLQPAGAKREGSAWTYSAPSVDLSALSTVIARIDAEKALNYRDLVQRNADVGNYGLKLAATGSSALAGGSYGASNLLDGKGDTAWCEGADGDGVGQYVELRAAPGVPAPQHCVLQALMIVPGYSKSQAVYENNGRASTVSIGACGSGSSS